MIKYKKIVETSFKPVTETDLFGCLWDAIWTKGNLIFEIRIFQNANFNVRQNFILVTKIDVFEYFWVQLEKNFVIFETSALEFVKLQSIIQNKISLNVEPKMLFLRTFRSELTKIYCYIWNHHPQVFKMQIYVQNQESLSLGSKLPELGISGLEFGKKLLFCLKSVPSNLLNCKLLCTNKTL